MHVEVPESVYKKFEQGHPVFVEFLSGPREGSIARMKKIDARDSQVFRPVGGYAGAFGHRVPYHKERYIVPTSLVVTWDNTKKWNDLAKTNFRANIRYLPGYTGQTVLIEKKKSRHQAMVTDIVGEKISEGDIVCTVLKNREGLPRLTLAKVTKITHNKVLLRPMKTNDNQKFENKEYAQQNGQFLKLSENLNDAILRAKLATIT